MSERETEIQHKTLDKKRHTARKRSKETHTTHTHTTHTDTHAGNEI